MTKLQQMLTSLVAAIPAAFLAYLLVMAMISHSENLNAIAYVVLGLTLLLTIVAALIPVGVMVGGKAKKVVEKPAAKSESGDDVETLDEDVEVAEGSSASIDVDGDLGDSEEFEMSDSDMSLGSDSSDSLSSEALDEFELDDEEEEEPKPKKKKR